MEHRWFIKYISGFGTHYAIVYGYPEFNWPRLERPVIYKKEIPKEFWGLLVQAYINFFEHNIKPRLTIKG